MPGELRAAVDTIKPEMLYPIHTEHPEMYAKFVSDKTRVKVPQKKVAYSLGS
jgi:mRNA degradation ribonuclease J1/J2